MGDSSSNNVRRCGQIGEGDEDVMTIEDAMNEQERLMEESSAVLGASDPVNCSYSKGYINRQALYACSTCTPNGNAGVCLACSYACHEGHDLHELYTKRYFSCDCGNDKFPGKECNLEKNKVGMNPRNRYNHNFKGLYCTCRKPYPDPDDSTDDEMIQCIMCEDWYHGRHLNTTAPDEFVEMICPECMSKYPFLWAYNQLLSYEATKDKDSSEEVDVVKCDQNVNKESGGNLSDKTKNLTPSSQDNNNGESDIKDAVQGAAELESSVDNASASNQTCESKSESSTLKRASTSSSSGESECSTKKMKLEEEISVSTQNESNNKGAVCQLKSLEDKQDDLEFREHATFWPMGWRSKLCKCEECVSMYQDRDIEFLTDESDTMEAYEERGNPPPNADGEDENEADVFAGLDRVAQIEVARGVQDLRSELAVFLQGFVREGQVVTETDIRDFFEQMEQRRRRRLNVPQHNCR